MKAPLCDRDFSVMVPVFESSHDAVTTKTTIQCYRCVKPRCRRAYGSDHGYFDWAIPWPPRELPRFTCRTHGSVMLLTKANDNELRFQCPIRGCTKKASSFRQDRSTWFGRVSVL